MYTIILTYLDEPEVQITTVSVGCGYVNISWNITDNNDECSVFSYDVTLSYVTMDDHVTESIVTTMNSSTITGLPDDTQINITVSGIGVLQDVLTFDCTSVSTVAFESMYVATVCMYISIS